MDDDIQFMRLAVEEARKGLGRTSPNPPVGAIITRDGKIIGRGWHRAAGEAHAEIEALRSLAFPEEANGATLYVTLEPCSTRGRTPPCTGAIIESGIRRVVIGAEDPNPAHQSRAREILEEAGIEVVEGIERERCRELIRAFSKWIATRRPWIIAKAGLSLDGKLTRPQGEDRWLTSEAARAHSMRLRAQCDAILIGGETVRRDNPALTVRGIQRQRQPWRVILTRGGKLPPEAAVFTDEHRERTLVFKNRPIQAVLDELGAREIQSVLVEGGGWILTEAFSEQLVDEVCFYYAPLIAGGEVAMIRRPLPKSLPVKNLRIEQINADFLVRGFL